MNKAFKATLVLQQQQVIVRLFCSETRSSVTAALKFPNLQFMKGPEGFRIRQTVRYSCICDIQALFLDTLNPFTLPAAAVLRSNIV